MEAKKISVFDAITFGFRSTIDHILFFIRVSLAGLIFIPAVVAIVGILNFVLPHIITIIVSILLLVINVPGFNLGLKKIAINMYDRRTSTVFTAFSYFHLAPKFMISWILYYGMVFAGLLMFIVPGVIFFLRFAFFPYRIVDKGAGIIGSLRHSWRVTKGHTWDLLVLWILIRIIRFLCAITLIGLILWPVSVLANAYVYRKLASKQLSEQEI